uniref:Pyridinium-3,5-bisthiocarboxylic acid mononucleotide nickel insertion protein n=1 Tax=Eubacterium plexicaudatum ASF492 TaxID=1235802 RepID=N1ZM49_9FIRM
MQTLYLECYSGISGDMTVAALLDLGADQTILEKALNSLPIKGFSIKISRVKKCGLDICDFNVILEQENHDHDMEYLHSPTHSHMQGHTHTNHSNEHNYLQDHNHSYDQNHLHEQTYSHEQHHTQKHAHSHIHRGLSDILSIIEQADMTPAAKKTAAKIFSILGESEAKAHGTTLENVHFHEVGAVDSIVDIISVAVCLDNLHISNVIIPFLQEGSGTIRCQHGILPIPVPATTNIVQKYNIPLQITSTQGEFVTPTGAAITAAIRSSEQLPKQFCIRRIGLGNGKRNYDRPNILRAMLIESASNKTAEETAYDSDVIYKLETNIDDCTGEMMGYVLDCLMQAGAKDVHFFPVYMKKNRPAYQLNVLCKEEDILKLEQIIFEQTTTIGIRRQRMERSILPRTIETIQTIYGNIQVKICKLHGKNQIYPEYESIKRICRDTGCSYPEIYRQLVELCRKQFP